MSDLHAITAKLSAGQVHALLGMGIAQHQGVGHDLLAEMKPDEQARAMKELLDDLGTPLEWLCRGPLSFPRLTDLPATEAACSGRQSILEILASSATNRRVVEALVDYGKLLADGRFPITTRLTGLVIGALASAVLTRQHHVTCAGHDVDGFLGMLDSLLGSDAAPAALRTQAKAAREALSDGS